MKICWPLELFFTFLAFDAIQTNRKRKTNKQNLLSEILSTRNTMQAFYVVSVAGKFWAARAGLVEGDLDQKSEAWSSGWTKVLDYRIGSSKMFSKMSFEIFHEKYHLFVIHFHAIPCIVEHQFSSVLCVYVCVCCLFEEFCFL